MSSWIHLFFNRNHGTAQHILSANFSHLPKSISLHCTKIPAWFARTINIALHVRKVRSLAL